MADYATVMAGDHIGCDIRYITYYLAALVLVPVIFVWPATYFVADDWPVLLKNMSPTWVEVSRWFTVTRSGWYRPVFGLYVAFLWERSGLNTVIYRWVGIILYAVICAHVGVAAHLLSQDRRVGIGASILFGSFAPHAEPVLWFSAHNELLVAVFVSTGLVSYMAFRRRSNWLWYVLSVISCLLGLASKETSIFFPGMLLLYDVLWAPKALRRSVRYYLPSVLLVSLGIVFALIRLQQGSPYSVQITGIRLLKNAAAYTLVGVFALPGNYALASLPSWRSCPLVPGGTLVISTMAIGLVSAIVARVRHWRVIRHYGRPLVFSVLWAVSALSPVLPIVAERTVFAASIGMVIALSILFVMAHEATEAKRLQVAILVLSLTYTSLNLAVLEYRSYWWHQAAITCKSVLTQLQNEARDMPPDRQIVLVGLPDHLEYAYTFRNAFPAASEVLGFGHRVEVVLDTVLERMSPQEKAEYMQSLAEMPGNVVFQYLDGRLVRLEFSANQRAMGCQHWVLVSERQGSLQCSSEV